jgi:hypothetical protein
VRIADAARVARSGDTVLLAPGDYIGDVASFGQDRLTVRADRCCARLDAAGTSAEGKGIFVIRGDDVLVENLEFRGARVAGRNGAGIRQEGGGRLTIRNCRFTGNEMGLLTSNDSRARVVVERSEFDHNGVAGEHHAGEPIGHQIYIGRIDRFELRDSYVHDGWYGHLVKSRARRSFLYYNRITDEGGRASYEIEFPEGGEAYVVGNIVQQSAATDNLTMIAFGAEGYRWGDNALYAVNNTLVDDAHALVPVVQVYAGAAPGRMQDNLYFAPGESWLRARLAAQGMVATDADLPRWREGDYRLRAGSPPVGRATDPGRVNGVSLRPTREPFAPRRSRPVPRHPYSPGALQSLLPTR